jgi:hypothetical protein
MKEDSYVCWITCCVAPSVGYASYDEARTNRRCKVRVFQSSNDCPKEREASSLVKGQLRDIIRDEHDRKILERVLMSTWDETIKTSAQGQVFERDIR